MTASLIPPFFGRVKKTNALIVVTSIMPLTQSYFATFLWGRTCQTFNRVEFTVCPKDFKVVLTGSKVENPHNHDFPYLVIEKKTGDVYLVLHSIQSAALCVYSAQEGIRGDWKLGQMARLDWKEVECPGPSFVMEIYQESIIKKDLYLFE